MEKFHTDDIVTRLYRCLCTDMQNVTGIKGLSPQRKASFGTIEDMRSYTVLLHDNLTPIQYKAGAQLNAFLKRYVFENDLITPNEREELTNDKFMGLQQRLATNYWQPRSLRLAKVLRRARSICRGILAGFSPQGDSPKGQFGTKATVGCPASRAYIDEKLLAKPITGSAYHVDWCIDNLLAGDNLLASILKANKHGYKICSTLAQVNVPKKYNIDRGINPNTLLGSYYSSSLGRILEEALRAEGLDIRRLQHRHGILARRASTTGKLATADLSDASHGFLSNIINAIMPRKWYRAIMAGVIRQVEVNGRVSRLESIMTMGIGFTFPAQTLLFYCLLRALSDLSGIKGLISVYGDDLIYPVKLHSFVVQIFSDLGFKLNLDKTFVSSRFKESCGSDYFKGVDVRPYSPEGTSERLGRTAYVAFCYKLLNGLTRRWDAAEIPSCVNLLKFEICEVMRTLYIVPQHFPDHSGWKVATSEYKNVHKSFCWWIYPIAPWVWDVDHQAYRFPFIQSVPRRRFVISESPYYWDKLRARANREPCEVVPVLALPEYIGEPLFKYKKSNRKEKGPQVRKKPTVADKGQHSARYEVTHDRRMINPKKS